MASSCNHPVEQLSGYRTLRPLSTRGAPREFVAVREGKVGFRRLCALRCAPADDHVGDALAREAAALARLHHPTILPAYDFLEVNQWRVLVLAFEGVFSVDRITTAMRKHPVRLDTDAAMFVAHATFDALAHAHSKIDADGTAIVHGDIHPANLIVRRDGHVLIRGFRGPGHCSATDDLNPYVAPEISLGHPYSTQSDIFGAAAVAWELLVGRPLQHSADAPLPSLAVARPDLAPELSALFDVCLSTSPHDRRIRAATMAASLRKAVNLTAGRESLERLYVRVLQRLPASFRSLCAGTLPPSVPVETSTPTSRYVRPEEPRPSVLIVGHPSHPLHRARAGQLEHEGVVSDAFLPALSHDSECKAEETFDDEAPTLRDHRTEPEQRSVDDDEDDTVVRGAPEPEFARMAADPPMRDDTQAPVVEPRSFPPVASESDPGRDAPSTSASFRRIVTVAAVCFALAPVAWLAGRYGARPLLSAMTGSESAAIPTTVPSTQPGPSAITSSVLSLAAATSLAATSAPSPSNHPSEVIPLHQTLLKVDGPPEGIVYVNGVAVGPTGTPALSRSCGLRFVRVGTAQQGPTLHGVRWLSRGLTARLPCGGRVELKAKPLP